MPFKVYFFFILSIFLIVKTEKVIADNACATTSGNSDSNTGVDACSASLQNEYVKLANQVVNLLPIFLSQKTIDICEILKEISKLATNSTSTSTSPSCSFFVILVATVNGTNTTMGQGVLSDNCTIITAYKNIQMSKKVYVVLENGQKYAVKCFEALNTPGLTANTFLVRLILETNSCNEWTCKALTYANVSPGSTLINGFITTRSDCTSTEFTFKVVNGTLFWLPTGDGLVIASEANAICPYYGGGVFISFDFKVYCMFYYKPSLVSGITDRLPVIQRINPFCLLNCAPLKLC